VLWGVHLTVASEGVPLNVDPLTDTGEPPFRTYGPTPTWPVPTIFPLWKTWTAHVNGKWPGLWMAKSTPSAGMPWSPTIGLYGRRTPSTEVICVHTDPPANVGVDPWLAQLVREAVRLDSQDEKVPARMAAKAISSAPCLG
jgi:hypothetical protein